MELLSINRTRSIIKKKKKKSFTMKWFRLLTFYLTVFPCTLQFILPYVPINTPLFYYMWITFLQYGVKSILLPSHLRDVGAPNRNPRGHKDNEQTPHRSHPQGRVWTSVPGAKRQQHSLLQHRSTLSAVSRKRKAESIPF